MKYEWAYLLTGLFSYIVEDRTWNSSLSTLSPKF